MIHFSETFYMSQAGHIGAILFLTWNTMKKKKEYTHTLACC